MVGFSVFGEPRLYSVDDKTGKSIIEAFPLGAVCFIRVY